MRVLLCHVRCILSFGFSYGLLSWVPSSLVGSVLWAPVLYITIHDWHVLGSKLGAHTRGS